MILQAEYESILRRLADLRPSAAQQHGDEQDVAVATEVQELTLLQRERLQKRALALEAALERVKDGSWGICLACDHKVEPRRLQAAPEAEYCLRCAERLERDAKAQRR